MFVADLLGRVDGQCSPSGFVLALWAVPAGKLSARGKNCPPLASRAICCCNWFKAARMPPPVRRRALCEADYVLAQEYQDVIRVQHAISAGLADFASGEIDARMRVAAERRIGGPNDRASCSAPGGQACAELTDLVDDDRLRDDRRTLHSRSRRSFARIGRPGG